MRFFPENDQIGQGSQHHIQWRHMHHHHTHAQHIHPTQWLMSHPVIIALILACALAFGMILLASSVDTGIRPDVLNMRLPAIHPIHPIC